MQHQLQAIVTLLALVNPAMSAAIFLQAAGTQSRRVQLSAATKAAVTVFIILVLAALFGASFLQAFGVSLDAFSVAGGGVLVWLGLGMMKSSQHHASPDPAAPADSQSMLTPLIMFAASPGTITGVITIAVSNTTDRISVTALVAVAVATFVMWLVILLAIQLSLRDQRRAEKGAANDGKQRSSFIRDTITRFMGLIVIAMGVQFALSGLRSFFNGATMP